MAFFSFLVGGLLYLASFTRRNVFRVHPYIMCPRSIPVYGCTVFHFNSCITLCLSIHGLMGIYLGCVHFVAHVNRATVNTGAQVWVGTCVFVSLGDLHSQLGALGSPAPS